MSTNRAGLRSIFYGGAAFGALTLAAGAAFAQTPAPQEQEPQQQQQTQPQQTQPQREERIVVTGSRIQRDNFTSASPITVITAEAATLEGLIDTADVLQSSSVASGSTQINQTFGGFVVEGGPGVNTISLRGLGSQRTLVLLNGRRLGGAGTQGQTGAVDLGAIPDSIVQRYEILKDGASSIYGSDAVAGVVNIITRTSVDRPELNLSISEPFDTGGEAYSLDGAIGFDFLNGGISIAASWEHVADLDIGEREDLACPADYVFDVTSNARVDLLNTRSDEPQGPKCFNTLQNVFDINGSPLLNGVRFTGGRHIPINGAPAIGSPQILFPGYRLRGTGNAGLAETDNLDPRDLTTDAINSADRYSLFATADFNVAGIDLYSEFLFNRREAQVDDYRQLFPFVDTRNAFNPFPDTTGTVGLIRPIVLIPFNTQADVDYYSGVFGAKGDFFNISDWAWDAFVSYTHSEGEYTRDTVDARNVEDFTDPRTDVQTRLVNGVPTCVRPVRGGSCPVINYFSANFLSGNFDQATRDFLLTNETGNTIYYQYLASLGLTGTLFELPAGPLGFAFGAEYREISLNDKPGPLSQGGNQWGLSSAGQTKGSDQISEAYLELEAPLIAGVPFVEQLTLNLSGRAFTYDTSGDDTVWKTGLNWQINPLFRLRGTIGTSYRSPALFELFLANQTSFLGQLAIDPCVNWQDDTNPNIRANCAADGVPQNYTGVGSSALIISGGGLGVLEPETSEASTIGFVFTPTQIDLNIAIDYFEIEVADEVARLGAGSILGGCYGSPVYPNDFCSLFTRDKNPNSPSFLNILQVRDSFLNINNQFNRGLDVNVRYTHEFNFGELVFEFDGAWTFEDVVDLFDGTTGGFETDDFNGTIGDPDFSGNARLRFNRGDWTYTWGTQFVGRASNDELFGASLFTYRGRPDTYFKQFAESTIYHSASVRYRSDDWTLIVGIDNLFDEDPPAVSSGATTRRGVAPLVGTQYDLRGRTAFATVSRRF